MRQSLKLTAVLIVTVATAFGMTCSYAEAAGSDFPNRPIELVIPYSPGGGSGITGETIKKIITEEKFSPQPITISYKPGGSGWIGWSYVAARKGSAYTIATATAGLSFGFVRGEAAQASMKPEDFTPIAYMAQDTQLLTAYPKSPYKTVKDIIEASKKKPNSVKVGCTGAVGNDTVVASMLEISEGIKLNKVPFQSGGDVLAAVLGGHVDLALGNPNELVPNVNAGKLRPLALFSDERLPGFQDVPTMKELGYNILFYTPRGIIGPANLAKNEEQWLIEMFKKVTYSKGWAEYCANNLMTAKFIGGADYGAYMADERTKLAGILKTMGIAPIAPKK